MASTQINKPLRYLSADQKRTLAGLEKAKQEALRLGDRQLAWRIKNEIRAWREQWSS